MFNEIIYPNTQLETDNVDASIGLVGVYSPYAIQCSLDTSSIDSLSPDFAITSLPTETTFDYPYWESEPLIAICDFPPLSTGEIHILPIDTTVTDPAATDSPIIYKDHNDPIYLSDPIVDTEIIEINTTVDSSNDSNASTDPTVSDSTNTDSPTEPFIYIDYIDPIDVSDPIIETGTIEIDPTIDPTITDTPIEPIVCTFYFDPIFVTDPTVFDYSDIFYYTYDPVVFDSSSEFYLTTDPIFTFDPIDVSDPTIETGIIEIDPPIDSSEVTNTYTDTSTTDSVVTDLTDSSYYSVYYTKDPIFTFDPVFVTDSILDSVSFFTDSPEVIYNLYDSSTDTSIDPTITETPVYKDDSTATDVLVLTDSTINDESDLIVLNYFRPTEINYRGISLQPKVSLQVTDSLVINPTIEANINLVDLSVGNSISLTPSVTDSSTITLLDDSSLTLISITDSSIYVAGKAKK